MGLDLDLIGRELPSTSLSWTSKDTLLYALAVGAGAADACDELELTTENSVGVEQVVLPGFAFTLAQRAGLTRHLDGVNPAVVLHADQSLDCAQPLPAEGEAIATPIVEAIYDKGRSALVRFATTVTAPDGTRYFTSRAGLFLDGLGGWGGERGPAAPTDVPHRPADATLHANIRPDQALLYRLCGDRNRLHSDPSTAHSAGFPRPILHGLCTLGVSIRLLLRKFATQHGNTVRRDALRRVNCRMSEPVLPGQPLTVRAWRLQNASLAFTAHVGDTAVIERGHLQLTQETS